MVKHKISGETLSVLLTGYPEADENLRQIPLISQLSFILVIFGPFRWF